MYAPAMEWRDQLLFWDCMVPRDWSKGYSFCSKSTRGFKNKQTEVMLRVSLSNSRAKISRSGIYGMLRGKDLGTKPKYITTPTTLEP